MKSKLSIFNQMTWPFGCTFEALYSNEKKTMNASSLVLESFQTKKNDEFAERILITPFE